MFRGLGLVCEVNSVRGIYVLIYYVFMCVLNIGIDFFNF